VAQGASELVTGPDLVLDHACSGSPLHCTTEGDPPAVSAGPAAGVETVGAVAYRWTAEPPGGAALDAHRAVTFSPSATVASPTVRIDVDQAAIASLRGDWVLRVAAQDDAGPLGEAAVRISVRNRPPVLVAAPAVSVDHGYASGSYLATAAASSWRDPDGDPLSAAGDSTGDATCPAYTLAADGTAMVSCARAFGGVPDLSGFVGPHPVSTRAADPWEPAAATATTTVTILNRPASAVSSTVAGGWHCSPGTSTDACCDPEVVLCPVGLRAKHCADLTPTPHPSVSDPDGDPLLVTFTGGDFHGQAAVCEPASCAAVGITVPGFVGCDKPSGTQSGTFTASDGLTTSGPATLTFTYQ
jgi:hypothetical protein